MSYTMSRRRIVELLFSGNPKYLTVLFYFSCVTSQDQGDWQIKQQSLHFSRLQLINIRI